MPTRKIARQGMAGDCCAAGFRSVNVHFGSFASVPQCSNRQAARKAVVFSTQQARKSYANIANTTRVCLPEEPRIRGSLWGDTLRVSHRRTASVGAAIVAALLSLCTVAAHAQNATWNLNGTGDFNTNTNWTPATVPTGTAFFGVSNQTNVATSATTTIGGWTFNAGASNYSFSINGGNGITSIPRQPAPPTSSGA